MNTDTAFSMYSSRTSHGRLRPITSVMTKPKMRFQNSEETYRLSSCRMCPRRIISSKYARRRSRNEVTSLTSSVLCSSICPMALK